MNGSNLLQLFMLIIVFVFILAATYFTTKWIARSGMIRNHARNIAVKETFKIATGKYIQIIRIGSKYYAIGVSKDQISFLTALDENQLDFQTAEMTNTKLSFKEMIEKMSAGKKSSDIK